MITITDPQGPDACRALIDGMMLVAHLKKFAPDIVLSANMSIIMAHAREQPNSRPAIVESLRAMLLLIESGEFPGDDQPLAAAPAGKSLH